MKQELKENQGLPASLLWTLAIIAGISVANLYYNQPLLNRISRDLQTSEFTANLIAMITQIGYAIGLLFIIPLGDLFKRKTIILINFTVLVVSLLTIALTPYIHLILFASLLTGICSVMPQIFIPIAAQFSTPETKGKNVGMIVSGLLTGILASRVVSGIIGEYLGWRFIFFVAAGMMVICVIIIMRVLPDMPCNFKGRYSDLMKSLFSLVMEYPQLRISSLRAGIAFGSFLALWTSLAFKMEQAPFFAGNNIVGFIGIMRHSRSSHRLVYRKLCTGFGSQTTELHRLWFDICSVVLALFRSELLCGNHHRNFYHRYRHAMHPIE